MIDTFSCIPFDLPHLIYKVELAIKKFFVPLKSYTSLKNSTLPATAVRFFTFTSNLHKVTSYTTYALNTRDFYSVLGEITWVR